jgi:hypothetical protein
MSIVMYNSKLRVEGFYVYCNLQQFVDSGQFLCTS